MTLYSRLSQYLRRHHWEAISPLETLKAGWETDVYAFTAGPRDLVLRLYNEANVGPRPATEAHALQWLRAAGYPVPELLLFEPDPAVLGGSFLIMERVRGGLLWQSLRGALLAQGLAELMYRLHRVDPAGVGPLYNTFDADFMQAVLPPAVQAGFAPALEALAVRERAVDRRPTAIIHGDFHADNVMVDQQGRPFVIDWSCATVDDPRVDLAQAMAIAITNGDEAWGAQVVQAYAELAGGPPAHFDHFVDLALTRRLAVIVAAIIGGAGTVGLRPGLETELRREIPKVRLFVGVLEQRLGVPLSGVDTALEAVATA